MLNSIKKYFKKVKEETSEESSIYSPGSVSVQGIGISGIASVRRPKIWTGVDLDGTLAYWNSTSSVDKIGNPIPAMLALVKKMVNNDIRVKIFTARAQDPKQLVMIRKWLKKNDLPELEITNVKNYNMQRLYDDRCIQVERNTGRLISDK